MVLSLIAALMGGAGSVASGIMGANAADDAQKTNWNIALLNYYQREAERRDRIRQATKTDREQKLGFTDADGSRVHFVPGVGWVNDLSDEAKGLQDAQRNEQMNVLQKDLPMRRRFMERNEKRSYEDESDADALRRNMRDLRRAPDSELESLLYNSAVMGMDDAFDKSQASAVTAAARTGSSNVDRILSGLNKDRAEAQGRAAMEAKLKARGSGDADFENKRSQLANLYNMFATRASVAPDVSYQPMNVDKNSQGMMAQGSKQAFDASKYLAEAFGAKGGTMDYVQPNYGWANAVGSGSNALSAMFKSLSQQGYGSGDGGSSYYNKYDDRLIG